MNNCGLLNLGNYCYLNSIIQILYHIEGLNTYLKNAKKINNIPESALSLELIKLNNVMSENNKVNPRDFIVKMIEVSLKKGRDEFCYGQQNDAN